MARCPRHTSIRSALVVARTEPGNSFGIRQQIERQVSAEVQQAEGTVLESAGRRATKSAAVAEHEVLEQPQRIRVLLVPQEIQEYVVHHDVARLWETNGRGVIRKA